MTISIKTDDFLRAGEMSFAEVALLDDLGQVGAVVGEVVQLQVQKSSVKLNIDGVSTYTTAPLFTSSVLQVGPDGSAAVLEGATILDVHHLDHDSSKNRGRANGLSLGFSYHYELMAAAVNRAIPFGCAGENVIVASSRRVFHDDVAAGMGFVDHRGQLVGLVLQPSVITPCRTFSRYLLATDSPPPGQLKETLQALDGGTRGFFGSPSRVFYIHVGDRLIAAPRVRR